MAFEGYEIIFDGISSGKYDLMLYDIGSNKQSETINITSVGKVVSDKVSSKHYSFLYGTRQDDPLEFNLVLTAMPNRLDNNQPFDKFEIQAITSWLTGHDTWKWLKIIQSDMEAISYRCLITGVTEVTYNGLPWALNCNVTCDSPYAYMSKRVFEYIITDTPKDIIVKNSSSYNKVYYPKMEIEVGESKTIVIKNKLTNKEFILSDLPASVSKIEIDNDKQMIVSNSGLNIYPNFNFNWIGLSRGNNTFTVTGDCKVKFICNFPANVGA